MKTNWEQSTDVMLKVKCQYFGANVGAHRMLSFARFNEEHNAHLKMSKLTKHENNKALTLYQ